MITDLLPSSGKPEQKAAKEQPAPASSLQAPDPAMTAHSEPGIHEAGTGESIVQETVPALSSDDSASAKLAAISNFEHLSDVLQRSDEMLQSLSALGRELAFKDKPKENAVQRELDKIQNLSMQIDLHNQGKNSSNPDFQEQSLTFEELMGADLDLDSSPLEENLRAAGAGLSKIGEDLGQSQSLQGGAQALMQERPEDGGHQSPQANTPQPLDNPVDVQEDPFASEDAALPTVSEESARAAGEGVQASKAPRGLIESQPLQTAGSFVDNAPSPEDNSQSAFAPRSDFAPDALLQGADASLMPLQEMTEDPFSDETQTTSALDAQKSKPFDYRKMMHDEAVKLQQEMAKPGRALSPSELQQALEAQDDEEDADEQSPISQSDAPAPAAQAPRAPLPENAAAAFAPASSFEPEAPFEQGGGHHDEGSPAGSFFGGAAEDFDESFYENIAQNPRDLSALLEVQPSPPALKVSDGNPQQVPATIRPVAEEAFGGKLLGMALVQDDDFYPQLARQDPFYALIDKMDLNNMDKAVLVHGSLEFADPKKSAAVLTLLNEHQVLSGDKAFQERITRALEQALGHKIRLEFRLTAVEQENSPGRLVQQLHRKAVSKAHGELLNDPNLQQLAKAFKEDLGAAGVALLKPA